jgi:MFS family permease
MKWIGLILLFFATASVTADKMVVGLAAGPLMKEFSLNASQWGTVGSSFFVLFLITSLVGGTWSDRFGTSKMILVVLAGISIVQFGALAVTGLSTFLLYRVMLGAAEGPYIPAALSHVSKLFPPNLRGFTTAVVASGGTVGGIIGAPVLVGLMNKYGWRTTFVLLGLFSMVLLVIWALLNRNSKMEQGVTAKPVPKLKWADVAPVLRNPACLLTVVLSVSSYFYVVFMVLWAPIYLTKVLKLASMQMAYTISASGIAAVVIMYVVLALSDYIFRKTQSYRKARVFVAGICTMIGALAVWSITVAGDSVPWTIMALCVGYGATYVNISMTPQVMIQLMPERSGFMISILSLGNNITQIVAPIVIGILVQSAKTNVALGFRNSVYLIAGLFLLTSILYMLFVRPDDVKETVTES